MRTSKLEPPCQNWFITRWVYPFVSANPRKSWRDQSPGAHLQDLGGLLIDEEVIQSIPQTVVPLSILHTNWLMITMLAHFSCLINIFFLESQHTDFKLFFLLLVCRVQLCKRVHLVATWSNSKTAGWREGLRLVWFHSMPKRAWVHDL